MGEWENNVEKGRIKKKKLYILYKIIKYIISFFDTKIIQQFTFSFFLKKNRWHNHLNPEINKEPWTEEEDEIIISKQKDLGNKWSHICKFLQGRTDNMVKNRWNSTLRRKLNGDTRTNKRRKNKDQTPKSEIISSKKNCFSCTCSFNFFFFF